MARVHYRTSVYLVRPDGTGLRRVFSGGFVSAPAVQWSPDGSRLAYLLTGQTCVSWTGKDKDLTCAAGALSSVNVDGGYEQVIEGLRTPEIAWIAWNPCDPLICTSGRDGCDDDADHPIRRLSGTAPNAGGAHLEGGS